MIASEHGGLRAALVWPPGSGQAPLDLAAQWADLLHPGRPACVWEVVPDGLAARPQDERFCWHALTVPSLIDRHVAASHPRLAWSPWGTKSGPNYQFFQVLDGIGAQHGETWTLLLEPDTHPLPGDAATTVRGLLDRHREAWMIGGRPHALVRPALAKDLREHLNGAALYRVASARFATFRAEVWIPSLVAMIQQDPISAFDCLTDPALQKRLPAYLQDAWHAVQHLFVPTSGIINVSSLELSALELRQVLADPALADATRQEETQPWLLHAKGPVATVLAELSLGMEAR